MIYNDPHTKFSLGSFFGGCGKNCLKNRVGLNKIIIFDWLFYMAEVHSLNLKPYFKRSLAGLLDCCGLIRCGFSCDSSEVQYFGWKLQAFGCQDTLLCECPSVPSNCCLPTILFHKVGNWLLWVDLHRLGPHLRSFGIVVVFFYRFWIVVTE